MAKIKFENGTVVNFDGNPTQQDIEEVALKLGISKKSKPTFLQDVKQSFKSRTDKLSGGYLRQIQGGQTPVESVLQTAGQGAGLLGDVVFGGVSRLASAITPDAIEKPVVEGAKKLIQKTVSNPLVGGAINKYQGFAEQNPRAAENIGAVANIATTIPTGKGLQIGGKLAGKTAVGTGKLLKSAEKSVASKTGNIAKFGVGQASGLNKETIEQIIKNPQAFTKNTVNELSRESVAKQVKQGITKRIDELKSVGSAYEPIRKSSQILDIPQETYLDPLKKFGLKYSKGKLITNAESKPFSSGELNQIEGFLEQYGGLKHTPNSALNAREALSNIAKFDTAKSNNLTSLAKDLRASLNNIIRNEETGIKGLKSIDNIYSAESSILKEIRKDYFKKGTYEFKDNAISKIANLTREGRQSVLERLKQIDPKIEFKVNILKAIEDIKSSSGFKVGTYARGAAAVGGVASGNIPLLLGAIVSQPEILVPILRAYGRIKIAKKGISDVIETKLKNGVKLMSDEKKFIDESIDNYSKKIIGK